MLYTSAAGPTSAARILRSPALSELMRVEETCDLPAACCSVTRSTIVSDDDRAGHTLSLRWSFQLSAVSFQLQHSQSATDDDDMVRLQRIRRCHCRRSRNLVTSQRGRRTFRCRESSAPAGIPPNDVDVFLLMADSFDVSATTGEARLLFDHLAADAHFGASVFWLRRLAALDGEQAAVEYWQVKRDGRRRGVVEIDLGAS